MAIARQNQETDQDRRLGILQTLLTTPHRELGKVYPIHSEMIKSDPLFYGHLGAWYAKTGEVRDHKEMFVVNLCLSNFEGHREAGLAMLRELPPYQVCRVADFINGRVDHIKARAARKAHGKPRSKDYRPAQAATPAREERVGLFKNLPRSLVTEVTRYLSEREVDRQWCDSVVLSARKAVRRLMYLTKYKGDGYLQDVVFHDKPPEGSSLAALKLLCKTTEPVEQAKLIMEHKIPYRVASTVVHSMTPTVILALIEVMSDQELINNMGSLKQRGVFDNVDLKKVIEERLEKAKKGKKVAALKAVQAAKASGVSEDLQEKLAEVSDAQLKNKGRIKRPTALFIDKSSSMHSGIELGKQMAAMVSTIMDAEFYVYAFDGMPYPIKANGTDLAAWTKAMQGINANGSTGCGAPLVAMRKAKQRVEQIVMITDEGETDSPCFTKALKDYTEELGLGSAPSVFILRIGKDSKITDALKRGGFDITTYEFNGDYYSLPGLIQYLTKPSQLELLIEIMSVPLPTRKAS